MCAVSNMDVFCSCFTSGFPGMLVGYFMNDFEMIIGAQITRINIITFVLRSTWAIFLLQSFYIVYYYYYYYSIFLLLLFLRIFPE
jgi:hypothetical protein